MGASVPLGAESPTTVTHHFFLVTVVIQWEACLAAYISLDNLGQSAVTGGPPPGHILHSRVCHSPLLQEKSPDATHRPQSAQMHLPLKALAEWKFPD